MQYQRHTFAAPIISCVKLSSTTGSVGLLDYVLHLLCKWTTGDLEAIPNAFNLNRDDLHELKMLMMADRGPMHKVRHDFNLLLNCRKIPRSHRLFQVLGNSGRQQLSKSVRSNYDMHDNSTLRMSGYFTPSPSMSKGVS